MNMILLFKEDFAADTDSVRLEGRRFKHIMEVHRASVGDELNVGLLGGLQGTGRVTAIDDGSIQMDVRLDKQPPAPLPITLVLALPRPKVLKRVIASVCMIGIKKIFLINAYRVERSFWQSPSLTEDSIKSQLILGLEQAKDTVLPEVVLCKGFKPFAENRLPGLIKDSTAILAHPAASEPCPRNVTGHATLAVGPEGGFIQYEVERLVSCGFRAVNLGERVLNVETALPFLVSRVC